jgi:predicted nucleotidyltransferase
MVLAMGIEQTLKQKRDDILKIASRYGAGKVRVFGSVVRGEDRPDSDVDFLVELEEGRSLMDLGGLLMDLQKLLGRNVDIVTEKGLHWYIKDRVLQEAKPI